MPAYCLFDNLEVVDSEKLDRYKERVVPVIEKYGGRYIAGGGKVDLMEGEWRPTYPVMLEFPSLADAHRWYASEEYRDLKALRLSAVRSNAVFIEGV